MTQNRGRGIMLKLALAFFSLLISGAIGEIIARAYGFHGANGFEIHGTILVNDPVLNWRHKPNSVFYFNDVVYRINEHGFRDYIYPYVKPANTYRIFLASDSVGFGTNVQMQDSYPKMLERKLNDLKLPGRVEVINYSMPGLSIKQKLHLVELYAKQYDPDLIIIDYVLNDIEFESRKSSNWEENSKCFITLFHFPISCALKTRLTSSAFLFLLKERIEALLQKLNWEDKNSYYDQVKSDYYQKLYALDERKVYLRNVFRGMRDYEVATGIPIVVPIFPVIYDYTNYRWGNINDFVMSLCKDNSLLAISLLEDYKKFPYNEMRIQRGDFTHPSIKGNIVAANSIARTLLKADLLKIRETSRSLG